MKKYYLLLTVSVLFSTSLFAEDTVTLTPTIYKVMQIYFGENSFRYDPAQNYSIGHESYRSEDDVWRSMYQFDLSSIPTNAIITNATLRSYVTGYISIDDGQNYYNQIVKLLSPTVDPGTFNEKQIFDSAAVGTERARHHYNDTANSPITNDIKARLSYGKIIYGGSCSQESYTTSKALLHLELTISYKTDADVIVKNSFNSGRLIVDYDTVNSGTSFNWTSGSSHTIKGFIQDVGGKHYPLKLENMWKNITTNQLYNQNPLPITITADAMYEAQFDAPTFTITLDQKLSDSTRVGTIGRWNGSTFPYPRLNPGDQITVTQGAPEILQGDQAIHSGQKYNIWKRNTPNELDIANHHLFIIQSNDQKLTSQFQPINNGTIQAQLIDGGNPGGNIEFRDPWYIDYKDSLYSNTWRNRGMQQAEFRTRNVGTNGFKPDTSTIFPESPYPYRGVFLMQRYDIPNSPYYTVRAPLEQPNINGVKGVFLNWYGNQDTVQYQNAYNRETPVVFKQSGAKATALYKGVHASNNANTFANSSQRKLVRTKDGWLHQVYESSLNGLSRVWLEHSTDNGATWFLGNNNQPLDNGAAKCPSIDWSYTPSLEEHYIVIVFQEKYANKYKIKYAVFNKTNGAYQKVTVGNSTLYDYSVTLDSYSANANPNITISGAQSGVADFVFSYERKTGNPGIYWSCGKIISSGISPANNYLTTPVKINGTDAYSQNATVSLNKELTVPQGTPRDFVIAYQQGTSSIAYAGLCYTYNGGSNWTTNQNSNPIAISNSVAPTNYSPSMVEMPDGNFRICWIRDKLGSSAPYFINTVYWNSQYPSSYTIMMTGLSAQSISLNVRDDNARTFYSWSDYDWSNNNLQNHVSNGTDVIDLSTTGKYVQLSNGPLSGGSTLMNTSSFYTSALPYRFVNAGLIGNQLQKASPGQITCGRGIVLAKGGVQLSYTLKSISVGNSNIKFIEMPEKKSVTRLKEKDLCGLSVDSINSVLVSEPFTLNEGSNIVISDHVGCIDSAAAAKELGANGFMKYKIELIDNSKEKTLAVIKEGTITSSKVLSNALSTLSANASKLGTNTVRVKVVISTNVEGMKGVIINEIGTIDKATLAKSEVEYLTLQNKLVPDCFALMQNYPNPFNPSTVINYHLPAGQAGLPTVGTEPATKTAGEYNVSLKVFDVLGREVATLADGMKEAGYYTATFDGSHLASGIYFARLTATPQDGSHPFVQVMKMLMTK